MRDLHFTKATEYLKASKTQTGNANLLRLARQSLYNSAEVAKHAPEPLPDWVQAEKIRKAREKRARKAARRTK